MTGYEQGDIVLVPYPFGERAGGKKRPVLVISSSDFNQSTGEVVIAQITSRMTPDLRPGDYTIQDWKEANLPRPSLVRGRLATLKSSLILRRLGKLTHDDLQAALLELRSSIIT